MFGLLQQANINNQPDCFKCGPKSSTVYITFAASTGKVVSSIFSEICYEVLNTSILYSKNSS